MENSNDQRGALLGELLAYKHAMRVVLKGHPALLQLRARILASKERGVADVLAEPQPDSVLAAYEQAMDAIAATLPTRPPSE